MKEILLLFFQGVMVLFTVSSTLLAAYSFQNKLRLRNVRLNWRAGKMRGYPLFATVFLGLITTLGLIVYLIDDTKNFGYFAAYVWIGGMWFISSYLASKHYITDHGIVKNLNEPSQTIPWFQILDFVEKESLEGSEYTFTYSEMGKSFTKGYKQLRLFVPASKRKKFQKVVSLKLKSRIESDLLPDIDLRKIQED
jgi:amino acid permease